MPGRRGGKVNPSGKILDFLGFIEFLEKCAQSDMVLCPSGEVADVAGEDSSHLGCFVCISSLSTSAPFLSSGNHRISQVERDLSGFLLPFEKRFEHLISLLLDSFKTQLS